MGGKAKRGSRDPRGLAPPPPGGRAPRRAHSCREHLPPSGICDRSHFQCRAPSLRPWSHSWPRYPRASSAGKQEASGLACTAAPFPGALAAVSPQLAALPGREASGSWGTFHRQSYRSRACRRACHTHPGKEAEVLFFSPLINCSQTSHTAAVCIASCSRRFRGLFCRGLGGGQLDATSLPVSF